MPVLTTFAGVRPLVTPRLLPDTAAQVAVNCDLTRGDLRPYAANLPQQSLPGSGEVKTLYRFGQDSPDATKFWWAMDVEADIVRSAIAGDVTERTFWTDGVLPKATNAERALVAQPYPSNYYRLGVPAPTSAPTLAVSTMANPPEGRELVDTVYIYTNVTRWGEESAPSPPSEVTAILPGDIVTLRNFSGNPSGPYDIVARRVYRLVTGTTNGDYLFVGEQLIAANAFVDSVLAEDLQEPCPSIGWDMPEEKLTGLIALPNGMMSGFVGRDWYVSDPWHPFAWPKKYSMAVDYPIVAQGAFGQSVVVLTTGNPYLISGSDPLSMGMQKLEIREACVSKRSVVQTGDGVIYASPNGLVYIGQSGNKILTDSILSAGEWAAYNPTTIHAYYHNGCYVGFYKTAAGVGRGFVYVGGSLVDLDYYADAGFVDIQRDTLFLAIGRVLNVWAGGSPLQYTPLTYTWRSKVFTAPSPLNLACGQVIAEAYPVTMRVYADGAKVHEQVVTNSRPFRLPSGFRARDWEFELSSNKTVYSAGIAASVEEFANG